MAPRKKNQTPQKVKGDDYGPIGDLPPVEEIQERINNRFDELFYINKKNERSIYVCGVCDEILMHRNNVNWLQVDMLQERASLLQWEKQLESHERVPEVEAQYEFVDHDNRLKSSSWLKGLALSPRAVLGRKSNHGNSKWGISCCSTCKTCVTNNTVPLFSIINKNYIGCAPECLKELTKVELALITPVRGYGYCYTYIGGENLNLRGTLSFMRVEETQIGRATMQLEAMGLNKHVVILLSGKMTRSQIKKVTDKRKVRTDKVLAAVEWLVNNNKLWKDVDLDKYRQDLEGCVPTVVNRTEECDSTDSNVEDEELFSCYFPDGAKSEHTGGFDNREDFQKYVDEMAQKGYNLDMQLDLQKQFLKAQEEDHLLVNACLLQFPYGVGGLVEDRVLKDGSVQEKMDLENYLDHLTKLSQPIFHGSLFQLILYSQFSKMKLLKRSRLQVRGTKTVEALSKGIDAKDVRATARERQNGNRNGGTQSSRTLLKAVDAISSALPHTDDAAKKARQVGESMQHHLGIASHFFTVTFDDENSILMQFLSREPIDDDTETEDLTDTDLKKRSGARRQLRLKYPGLSALNFEMLLYIVCEEVVGWDIRRNCQTETVGLFGVTKALAIANEEQGRKTLHAHMSVWTDGFRQLQQSLFFGEREEKRTAESLVSKYQSRLVTTKLMTGKRKRDYNRIFNHACRVPMNTRNNPEVVSDQDLRHLRHRKGYDETHGKYAFCPDCEQWWTYEQMLNEFVREEGGIPDNTFCSDKIDSNEIPKLRMQAKIIEYQKWVDCPVEETPVVCINALYQAHESKHRKGCWKCQKTDKKKTHTCGPKCECRMRLPDKARQRATVRTIAQGKPWIYWNGSQRMQPLVEILPSRGKYDCFQNKSCQAVSESKLSCNTNLSLISDGPVGQYQFKYQMKGTQGDDTADYALVEKSIKSMEGRRYEDDKKEVTRIICRAAFAHNKKNVIGAPMASYLTRHGSRFFFSHEFGYCPLTDLVRIHNKEEVESVLKYSTDGTTFFENQALHYLCRHKHLEKLSAKDFYEQYQVVPMRVEKKRKNDDSQDGDDDDEVLRFANDTGSFRHPSARVHKNGNLGSALQGAKERETKLLIRVSGWTFPDTGKFGDNILSCREEKFNVTMEKYAQLVLTLFYPHRSGEDFLPIQPNPRYKYLQKFREVHQVEYATKIYKVFTDDNLRFLQNIQDCHYNSMRYKLKDDDLQSCTLPFCCDGIGPSEEDDEEEDDTSPYEDILEDLEDEVDTRDDDPEFLPQHLQGFTFKKIRNKGTDKCGLKKDIPIPEYTSGTDSNGHGTGANEDDFVQYEVQFNTGDGSDTAYHERRRYGKKKIVEVFLHRSTPKQKKNLFQHNPDVTVSDANGSMKSIDEWATAANLDDAQRRAFECMVASFLLTFYEESTEDLDADPDVSRTNREFRRMHNKLKKLRGQKKRDKFEPLICLVHGPGGSGKSTVINLVTAYAREFCELMGHPFTARTIVITAMSGVAATLLHGETTHKAMGLNCEKELPEEMKEAWEDTRLVIIDEISFAGAEDFARIQQCAQDLMRQRYQKYGGLNIVFAGDYSQLEPVNKRPVYEGYPCPEFHGMLNMFIELDGHHRFRSDPEWGRRLFRFREGEPTDEDIALINEKCLIGPERLPPPGVQVACQKNKDRDAVNSSIFEQYCEKYKPANPNEVFEGAIILFMSGLKMCNSQGQFVTVKSNAVSSHFYAECGEDSCRRSGKSGGRVDPVLKLYPKCPMMLTQNTDVAAGEANGTRLFLEKVNVAAGEQPFHLRLQCGTRVRAFFANQIRSLIMRHEVTDIVPQLIEVTNEDYAFTATIPIDGDKIPTKMKGTQFPVISNSATTGHKLQGYTAKSLLANCWHYASNWAYVVMSRVTTMDGLYMRQKLSNDKSKFAMPKRMKDMLDDFRQRIAINKFTAEERAALLRDY